MVKWNEDSTILFERQWKIKNKNRRHKYLLAIWDQRLNTPKCQFYTSNKCKMNQQNQHTCFQILNKRSFIFWVTCILYALFFSGRKEKINKIRMPKRLDQTSETLLHRIVTLFTRLFSFVFIFYECLKYVCIGCCREST